MPINPWTPPATLRLNLAAVPDIAWRLGGNAAAAVTTYVATLMYHGVAAPTNTNNQLVLAGSALAFIAFAVRSAMQGGGTATAAGVEQQRTALTTLASHSLSDPVAMGLVQRLSRQLSESNLPSMQSPAGPRPVSDIMGELEARLRQDMAATVMPNAFRGVVEKR